MHPIFRRFGFLVVLLLSATAADSHHSSAPFDHDRILRLQGTVVTYKWANPHVYIDITVKGADGVAESWLIEGLPPAGMREGGWTRDSLVPGDQIIIEGNPPRNPTEKRLLGISAIAADGTALRIGDPRGRLAGPGAAELVEPIVADSLAGRWVTRWNPDVAVPFLQAGRFWAVTAAGAKSMDAYDSSQDPGARCVPEPIPYVMIWPSGKEFEITDKTVRIRDEMDVHRTIHLDQTSHDGAQESVHGHSIGWWEDGALVVDTTHFSPHRRGLALGGLPSGESKHLVERFELNDDRTNLLYSFRLEDDDYLAEPVTGELTLLYRPDLPFLNEACDLESAGRHLLD